MELHYKKAPLYRYFFLLSGLTLFALGNAIAVKVLHVGLHPWEVMNVALYERIGFTIGTWNVIIGILLVTVVYFFSRSYIHIGTFCNALLIGPIMDFFLWLDILPKATHTWMDYFILLSGIMITGIGGGLYVAAGLGAGPRDGFMLAISDRTGLSVAKARIMVESIVLIIGFLLGGPIFIMTFIYTFIQSPVFQKSLQFFKGIVSVMEEKKSMANTVN
ncbi:YczE/YyaS/YitT family protein [Bacillus pinisoli]|uniref:YczE/YyaS/YitT family protein n=1 Tax=Bacillus pinisoli TaxID=2901866 RepID=UPI001FF20326|nr:hypothetical protein [Bacillus pinisoli]